MKKLSERESARSRKKSPPERYFYRMRRWSTVWMGVDLMEGIMFDFIVNRNKSGRKKSVPRPSLYCVWIYAHEGPDAPLIRVWIDPAMSMFDSQARVHEPDLAAARAEAQTAPAHEENSEVTPGGFAGAAFPF
jgi:hypothetical protein